MSSIKAKSLQAKHLELAAEHPVLTISNYPKTQFSRKFSYRPPPPPPPSPPGSQSVPGEVTLAESSLELAVKKRPSPLILPRYPSQHAKRFFYICCGVRGLRKVAGVLVVTTGDGRRAVGSVHEDARQKGQPHEATHFLERKQKKRCR